MPATSAEDPRGLAIDRLPSAGPPVEVVFLDDASVGRRGAEPRPPHRHGYHELIWTRRARAAT